MPTAAASVSSGDDLRSAAAALGTSLGLDVKMEVKVGKRVWGAERRVDVVMTHPGTRQILGIECRYQGTSGTAEEKIFAALEDIQGWPMRGLVVIAGSGFSSNMRGYLISTGKVVDFSDLGDWLALYFGL